MGRLINLFEKRLWDKPFWKKFAKKWLAMFEVILTESFAKEFGKLEEPLRDRVKKKLGESAEKPFHFFERLQGQELFKLRIGKYRIIAQISVPKQQITLLSIGHRKNVYEKI